MRMEPASPVRRASGGGKGTDAKAVGAGKPTGAVKAARAVLNDAEDQQDAAKSAQTMLAEQLAAITTNAPVALSGRLWAFEGV
jgi:hypothetical protein